jgi:hypothetical protein
MRKEPDHDKQNAHDAIEAMELREREVADRLKALIAKKRADALEGEHPRTRGHATRVLRPRMDDLRDMMILGMSLAEMTKTLAEAGVMVSYQSLRTFLIKHMPADYREFMAIGPGKAMPAELSQAEQESVDLFLSGSGKQREQEDEQNPVGKGNRKEEAPIKETKPAATGEQQLPTSQNPRIDPAAIGLSSEERKAMADEEARRIEETYNKPHKPKN